MSLYRKYRPTTFADVYGQEHVVSTLEAAVAHDQLAHAYLFAGSRGTGKTSVARILAKELMTRDIADEAIRTSIGRSVEEGTIVDLLEIDAASNRGIDDVRDLIEKIQFSPVVASAKVYIVDEVHMLTKEAFNALLKTLEEPPPFAYFILATTELNKIPDTIQSRCQCFPFRHIKDEDIIRRLTFIAEQEQMSIEPEALSVIAHVSEGGMRDAISLLDQMRSLDAITKEAVEQRIGSTGREYVERVLQAMADYDTKAILQSIAEVEDAGVPLDVFTRQLLRAVRQSLHERIAKQTPIDDLLALQRRLLTAIADMRFNPVPGLVLEAALLAGPAPVIRQPAPPPPTPTPTPTPPPTPNPTPTPSAVSIDAIRSAWTNVLNTVTPASVKMSLKNARIADLDGNTLILAFSSGFHRDKVRSTEGSRAVEEVLRSLFDAPLSINCELDGNQDVGAKAAREEPEEELVNLADAAAEIF